MLRHPICVPDRTASPQQLTGVALQLERALQRLLSMRYDELLRIVMPIIPGELGDARHLSDRHPSASQKHDGVDRGTNSTLALTSQ